MFQGRGGYNDPHPSNKVYIWTLVLEDEIYLPNFYGLESALQNFPPQFYMPSPPPQFYVANNPPQFYQAELPLRNFTCTDPPPQFYVANSNL